MARIFGIHWILNKENTCVCHCLAIKIGSVFNYNIDFFLQKTSNEYRNLSKIDWVDLVSISS